MKHRLYALLLCVTLLCLTAVSASALQYDGFNYYIEDGEAVIYGYEGSSKDIVIPEMIDGYEVTELGYDCFSGYHHLDSITLPDTLEKIGWSAFASCSGLKSLVIPAGVTEIGRYAFAGCSLLQSITLPDSLEHIRRYTFDGCKNLREIVIPANVAEIDGNAFEGCIVLRKVTFMGKKTEGPAIGELLYLNAEEKNYAYEFVCWENSYFDKYVKSKNDTKTTVKYLDAKNAPQTTEIQVAQSVPKKAVKEPTLVLTNKDNLNAVDLEKCALSFEILKDKTGRVEYDIQLIDQNGDPVSFVFESAETLILPYPKGISYATASSLVFTVRHETKSGVEMFYSTNGGVKATPAGLELCVTSFSPFILTWEPDAQGIESLPKTGDDSFPIVPLAGMAVLCLLCAYGLKRRTA